MQQAFCKPTSFRSLKAQGFELREELRLPRTDKVKVTRCDLAASEKLNSGATNQNWGLITSCAQSPNSDRQQCQRFEEFWAIRHRVSPPLVRSRLSPRYCLAYPPQLRCRSQ